MPREDASGEYRILLLGWQGTLRPVGEEASAAQEARAVSAFRPWLDTALRRLQDNVSQEHCVRCGKRLPVEQLLTPLLHRLMGIAAAACWRESERHSSWLNVHPADALSASRYVDYAETLIQQWVGATGLFLRRLHTDSVRLSAWMVRSDMPGITGLAATNSDLHDAGGATVRIEFSDGSCVFYKPRPVVGELLWYELTRATTLVDPDCEVTAARVLRGGNESTCEYGWMDELRRDKMRSKLTPVAYWQKAGSLLCHAWIANMTDLHMGNVLATSTGPAVVDAECLATPEKVGPAEDDSAARLSIELVRTGLLPAGARKHSKGSDSGLPDLSGFFGNPESVPGIRLPVWIFHENGSASLTFKPGRLVDQGNRSGEDSSISCVQAVVEGFVKAAQALVQARGHLLEVGGWLDRLGSLHAPRVLLRDTLDYTVWLNEILLHGKTTEHRSGKDLTGDPGRTYRITPEYVSSVYEEERRAVERLHVPRFFIPGSSRDLSANLGSIVARNVIEAPFTECVRARLEGLSLNSLQPGLMPALLWPLLHSAGSTALTPTARVC